MIQSANGFNTFGSGAAIGWEMRWNDYFSSLPEEVQEAINAHADEFRSEEDIREFVLDLEKHA